MEIKWLIADDVFADCKETKKEIMTNSALNEMN